MSSCFISAENFLHPTIKFCCDIFGEDRELLTGSKKGLKKVSVESRTWAIVFAFQNFMLWYYYQMATSSFPCSSLKAAHPCCPCPQQLVWALGVSSIYGGWCYTCVNLVDYEWASRWTLNLHLPDTPEIHYSRNRAQALQTFLGAVSLLFFPVDSYREETCISLVEL